MVLSNSFFAFFPLKVAEFPINVNSEFNKPNQLVAIARSQKKSQRHFASPRASIKQFSKHSAYQFSSGSVRCAPVITDLFAVLPLQLISIVINSWSGSEICSPVDRKICFQLHVAVFKQCNVFHFPSSLN